MNPISFIVEGVELMLDWKADPMGHVIIAPLTDILHPNFQRAVWTLSNIGYLIVTIEEMAASSETTLEELDEWLASEPLLSAEYINDVRARFAINRSKSYREDDSQRGYVYVLKEVNGHHYKIGMTSNPRNRKETFGVLLPFRVDYEIVIECADMKSAERELHSTFARKRVNGEWFLLTPDDLESIRQWAATNAGTEIANVNEEDPIDVQVTGEMKRLRKEAHKKANDVSRMRNVSVKDIHSEWVYQHGGRWQGQETVEGIRRKIEWLERQISINRETRHE